MASVACRPECGAEIGVGENRLTFIVLRYSQLSALTLVLFRCIGLDSYRNSKIQWFALNAMASNPHQAIQQRISSLLGKVMIKIRLVGFLSAAVFCMTMNAATVTINNPSFEAPALTCAGGPSCQALPVPSWTSAGAADIFKPSVGAGQEFTSLPDGAQVGAVANTAGSGELFQDLSATLAANTTYTLTFWVGHRSDDTFDTGYLVSLIANGVTLASKTGASPAAGSFVQQTLTFTTGASPAQLGKTLRIDLQAPSGNGQADFDQLSLTAVSTVPEPSTFALWSIGFGLVVVGSRIRRAKVR